MFRHHFRSYLIGTCRRWQHRITLICLLMLLSSIGSQNVHPQQGDEFDGSGQNLQPFWQVRNGDKSAWELKDGQLVINAGFNQNLHGPDTTTRFYQVTDKTEFDIETSMVVDYADVCAVAGLVVYSATGDYVTLKLHPYHSNPTAALQFQRHLQGDIWGLPNIRLPIQEGRISIQMRIKRDGDTYETWYKSDAQGDWISVGSTTAALQGPVEIGIYAGICEGQGPGRLTVTYDYFRVTTDQDASTDTPLRTLTGHTYDVNSVAFSPDGTTLASGSDDSTVRIWDTQTGAHLRTLTELSWVGSVAFSPDGTTLATGRADYRVSLWDTQTGTHIRTLTGHTLYVSSVAYSPDGTTLASGSEDDTVRVWDAETGAHIRTLTGHTNAVLSVAYSPDGTTLASGSNDGTVRIWDTQTGAHLRTLTGHTDAVFSVAYSPDGSTLASGSGRWGDQTVRIWDTQTGAPIRTLTGHTDAVYSVAFSPDGTTLVTGSADNTVRMWDIQTGAPLRTLTGHTSRVESVAFSPDGTTIASGGGWDDNTVRLWEIAPATEPPPSEDISSDGVPDTSAQDYTQWGLPEGAKARLGKGDVNEIAYSPDGTRLAVASGSGIWLYDTATHQVANSRNGEVALLMGHTSAVYSIAFSPDGSTLASASWDGTVRIWDTQTGAHIRTLTGHTHRVFSVAYSPDGSTLASGSDDATVRMWDAQTGTLIRTLTGHRDRVESVAFSPDGSTLASGSDDATVRMWDAKTGTLIRTLTGHTDYVYSVAYSPDGTTLASGSTGQDITVRMWDAKTGALIRTLTGYTGAVYSIAFSPDGSTLASGSDVWDAKTGAYIRTLTGYRWWVFSVAFSPDGSTLASGGNDTVRMWDAQTGTLIRTLTGHMSPVHSVVFSPDGSTLASGDHYSDTVKMWDTQTGAHIRTITEDSGGQVLSIAYSPDGTTLAGGSYGKVSMWDAQTGTLLRTLTGHTSFVYSVSFSPDGNTLASASDDSTVRLWDTQTGAPIRTLTGHTDWVSSVVFSPDGTTLASGSYDNTVRLWDTQTGAPIRTLTGHTHRVYSVSFSPDGTTLASGSWDNTVRMWDAQTGAPIRTLTGHGTVKSVTYSPDGSTLASGSDDSTVRLWDAQTGASIRTLTGHTFWVNSVAFSPDGSTLASGSHDGTVLLWELAPSTIAEYSWSIPADISLIHVPLKVTAVDGVAKPITSIADLYDALGGADTVNFLITLDPATQQWLGYFSAADKGTAADRTLTDDMGIVAGMKAPVSIGLSGDALGTNGSSTITLAQNFNLIGLPLRDSRITVVSDLLTLPGMSGNVHTIILSDSGEFKVVARAGDAGDIPVTAGKAFILIAGEAATVSTSGQGWHNGSGAAAAPTVSLPGIKTEETTPILALRGSVVAEAGGLNRAGFRVTAKNLSTGRAVTGRTQAEGGSYQLIVVDIQTTRAAQIGDILEITAQSADRSVEVEPLRYTVTAADVKRSQILLETLIAYEIPTETALLRNYPNPFNPETWIPYHLAAAADVHITIYDIKGAVVRQLDLGYQQAGYYANRSKAAYWDGRNESGELVASGIYFYTLKAKDFSATKRMVIVK